ncbi:ubiquitin carboxyl-terminal hydrolase 5 [Anaeramoeba ignava]|nr:ubiquitin carboxyl-terminal hydrolase 5 [Anaeramoeba ignava]
MDININLPVDEEIDLEFLRAKTPPENEQLFEEDELGNEMKLTEKIPVADENIVSQLELFGFPKNRAEKAALTTQNASTEIALNWLLEHQDDPDIDVPFSFKEKQKDDFVDDPIIIEQLTSMGFSKEQSIFALRQTQNNPDRAVDYLFNHQDDIEMLMIQESTKKQEKSQDDVVFDDDENLCEIENENDKEKKHAKFVLSSFIVHMGSTPQSGHYVAYIKKNDKWILFNDSKVVIDDDPYFGTGYIYFFKRI